MLEMIGNLLAGIFFVYILFIFIGLFWGVSEIVERNYRND